MTIQEKQELENRLAIEKKSTEFQVYCHYIKKRIFNMEEVMNQSKREIISISDKGGSEEKFTSSLNGRWQKIQKLLKKEWSDIEYILSLLKTQ